MANAAKQSPSRPPISKERTVTLPYELVDTLAGEIARAHLSLHVLAKLFRNGKIDDEEACMPHLLGYIVEGLEKCDGELWAYLHQAS